MVPWWWWWTQKKLEKNWSKTSFIVSFALIPFLKLIPFLPLNVLGPGHHPVGTIYITLCAQRRRKLTEEIFNVWGRNRFGSGAHSIGNPT